MLASAGLGVALAMTVCGQTGAAEPAFEVASIKLNTTGERDSNSMKGDRLTMTNFPLLGLIAFAYDVPFDRITGPESLQRGYDIVAKCPPNTTREDLRRMTRNLLVDRFKLTVHREQKQAPVYALVVSKKGLKLRVSTAPEKVSRRCTPTQEMQMTCSGEKWTLAELADTIPHWLSRNWLDAPVVDQTGAPGSYDFRLTWTMTNRSTDTVEPPGLSLFDALEEQLGLRLEPRKAPLERLVVDHVEAPTEN
jgi:uncharacterized protein (TIGR03435 family)